MVTFLIIILCIIALPVVSAILFFALVYITGSVSLKLRPYKTFTDKINKSGELLCKVEEIAVANNSLVQYVHLYFIENGKYRDVTLELYEFLDIGEVKDKKNFTWRLSDFQAVQAMQQLQQLLPNVKISQIL